MASDEEEEELAQLRAQRSQRTGVTDLVRRADGTGQHLGCVCTPSVCWVYLLAVDRAATAKAQGFASAERPSTTEKGQYSSVVLL